MNIFFDRNILFLKYQCALHAILLTRNHKHFSYSFAKRTNFFLIIRHFFPITKLK